MLVTVVDVMLGIRSPMSIARASLRCCSGAPGCRACVGRSGVLGWARARRSRRSVRWRACSSCTRAPGAGGSLEVVRIGGRSWSLPLLQSLSLSWSFRVADVDSAPATTEYSLGPGESGVARVCLEVLGTLLQKGEGVSLRFRENVGRPDRGFRGDTRPAPGVSRGRARMAPTGPEASGSGHGRLGSLGSTSLSTLRVAASRCTRPFGGIVRGVLWSPVVRWGNPRVMKALSRRIFEAHTKHRLS